MALLAAGVMLMPGKAFAQVTATEDITVNIPTAAAWSLNATAAGFTITSQNFTFTGGPAAVPITNISFGDPTGGGGNGISYLVTNDDANVKSKVVTVSTSDVGGSGFTTAFTDVNTINIQKATRANFNIKVYNFSGAGTPWIGASGAQDFTFSDPNIVTAGNMTVQNNYFYPISMLLNVDESTLTEADPPDNITLRLTFTVAGVTP